MNQEKLDEILDELWGTRVPTIDDKIEYFKMNVELQPEKLNIGSKLRILLLTFRKKVLNQKY